MPSQFAASGSLDPAAPGRGGAEERASELRGPRFRAGLCQHGPLPRVPARRGRGRGRQVAQAQARPDRLPGVRGRDHRPVRRWAISGERAFYYLADTSASPVKPQ